MSDEGEIDWTALPIVCPHCGNHGEPEGAWSRNAPAPFKLTEQVYRLWRFAADLDEQGVLILTADANSDTVDWESGNGERFACMACFGEFPVPETARLDFE